ncbi:hypothetical protein AB0B07_23945 [Streptomyces sioyaensis]|uniref:RraA family protein n=1 Tax=Streptomyces sioyaensis TaxID=67364 RepID=UPI0033E2132B
MKVDIEILPSDGDASVHGKLAAFLAETGVSTCAIADALDGLGVPNAVLDSHLRCQSKGTGMSFGAAFPVSWVPVRKSSRISEPGPSTWAEVRDFLVPEVTDGSGRFYVAGAGPLVTDAALAGGMSTTYLIEGLRFEGMILGGAVRDRDLVEQCEAPVVASNFIPTDTQGSYRVVSVGDTCQVGHTLVAGGDWVFTDGNGTVLVPRGLVQKALTAAAAIEESESLTLARVRAGESLPKIVDEMGQI